MRLTTFLPLIFSLLIGACSLRAESDELSREQAIERARTEVDFEPELIEAEKTREGNRPVWRITFQGAPLMPQGPLRHTLIVTLDRVSGRILSLARS